NLMNCKWFAGYTWSLAYEEQFYVVFAVCFGLLGWRFGKASLLLVGILLALPFLAKPFNLGPSMRTILGFCGLFALMSLGCASAAYEKKCANGRTSCLMG